MKRPQPRDLSRHRIVRLLAKNKNERSIASRIETFSRHFLGRAYKPNPLIGSPRKAEGFTAAIAGFDCVTYIETVLALALASNVDDFVECLRAIRYEHGRIQWKRRNHYMTLWIRNNTRNGMLKPVSIPAVPKVIRERVLNVVAGLDPQRTSIKCLPKAAMPRFGKYLQTADLIFFASTRKHLDVFHAGIILRDGEKILMRHASRRHGAVVEQELSEFLKANRMAGVIVVRPKELSLRAAAGMG